jgi:hypothetical protein
MINTAVAPTKKDNVGSLAAPFKVSEPGDAEHDGDHVASAQGHGARIVAPASQNQSESVANVQLRQGFRLAWWGRKGEQHGGRLFNMPEGVRRSERGWPAVTSLSPLPDSELGFHRDDHPSARRLEPPRGEPEF